MSPHIHIQHSLVKLWSRFDGPGCLILHYNLKHTILCGNTYTSDFLPLKLNLCFLISTLLSQRGKKYLCSCNAHKMLEELNKLGGIYGRKYSQHFEPRHFIRTGKMFSSSYAFQNFINFCQNIPQPNIPVTITTVSPFNNR